MGRFKPPTRSLGTESRPADNNNGFIFSSNIRDWIRPLNRKHQAKASDKYHAAKKLVKVRLPGVSRFILLNDNLGR